jgi:hypothetical protein
MNGLTSYQEWIDKATSDLRSLPSAKDEAARLQREIRDATNRFVIVPVLGSTLVTVQNVMEPIAAENGLQIESFVERGRVELPVSKKDAGMTIERYLMEVTLSGSYGAVRGFLQSIEKANEYVCVSDVEILGRGDSPAVHKVRIGMEWPVFGEFHAPDSTSGVGHVGGKARKGESP